MYPRLRRATLAAGILMTVVLGGCATLDVSSYVERGADLNRYHTYAWAPTDRLSTGDPRLDNNPFFLRQVQTSVDGGLARRGFERVGNGTPDLVVHFHASVTQAVDVDVVDRQFGETEEADRPSVYEAGSLVIDLVDARTNSVVWRGWARGSIDGVIDNQAWLEEKVDEAVTKILAELPRTL
jgi:hypothetical protein